MDGWIRDNVRGSLTSAIIMRILLYLVKVHGLPAKGLVWIITGDKKEAEYVGKD